MFSEPSIRHTLQGEMPPSEDKLKPRYWEVLLEDSPTSTMYLWVHMIALQFLPGRVPADASGFHFPNMVRQCALELVQKRPTEYTYNDAMNLVKKFLILKTVTNFNIDLINFMISVSQRKSV